ncbi:hypothetical protein J2W22_000396 [Sphingomonas kyeonggiensis]|uniref:glycine-rich domain-containing protein n=1 Tax=Sphingomonas kyeonggiensis TaxID=1268553 RepID=UPI0027885A72|nr:hypothetical protein [Sphingomonas kyeonggiensis]MDQ0248349.1 hypothetical protein [Sphingomonas kyeonggiensis]
MTVHTYGSIDFNQPNTGSPFPTLNGDLSVLARLAAAFAPHETAPPSMAVTLDAGALFVAGAPVEVKAQTSATIAPPTANPRIDRVTISPSTGLLTVTAGTEAANPVPPAVPAGQLPVAQLRLDVGMTAITNARIRDERVAPTGTSGGGSGTAGGLVGIQTFTSSGTYTPSAGTASVVVELVGGGGAGGGCAATSGAQGSAGSGGSSGSYARARLTTGFAGLAVTVGAGGAPSSAAARGNAGSASSFGTLVTAPGGLGGMPGYATSPGIIVGGSDAGPASTGGNLVNTAGNPGDHGLVIGLTAVVGGNGGGSPFGGGGNGGGNTPGYNGLAPGAGGGGASSIAAGTARNSGAGANGLVIVYEYSA